MELDNSEQFNMFIGPVQSSDFFEKCVATRRVAKFDRFICDQEWLKRPRWTNNYLKERSGCSCIRVEKRDSPQESFGRGNEVTMAFGDFISALEDGKENLYLTTQELDYDSEGKPSLISAPLSYLVGDFPWVPELFGKMITQNINLWMGSTSEETSSGLHHDFHDNLYILLRGRKRFVLYSPDYARCMYTYGDVAKLHPNGRINYRGQTTNADGSAPTAEAAILASEAIIKAALKLDSISSDDKEKEDVEAELENALDAALDAEFAEDDFEADSSQCEDEYDGSSDDEFHASSLLPSNSSSRCEESASKSSSANSASRAASNVFSIVFADSDPPRKKTKGVQTELDGAIDPGVLDAGSIKHEASEDIGKEPPNFSRVDTSLPEDRLREVFPLYLEARKHAVEINLKAGEMLYIPAGWFHEVFSVGSVARSTDTTVVAGSVGVDCKEEEGGGHMALNYWFHPPDNLDFDRPYTSDFWMQDWISRGLPLPQQSAVQDDLQPADSTDN